MTLPPPSVSESLLDGAMLDGWMGANVSFEGDRNYRCGAPGCRKVMTTFSLMRVHAAKEHEAEVRAWGAARARGDTPAAGSGAQPPGGYGGNSYATDSGTPYSDAARAKVRDFEQRLSARGPGSAAGASTTGPALPRGAGPPGSSYGGAAASGAGRSFSDMLAEERGGAASPFVRSDGPAMAQPRPDQLACDYCGAVFSSPALLRVHMRMCTAQKAGAAQGMGIRA